MTEIGHPREGRRGGKHTKAVFKLALHNRIINVRQNLQLLNMLPQARQSQLLHPLAPLQLARIQRLQPLNLGQLRAYRLDLLLPIGADDGPRLLEALVGELLEGHVGAGAKRGAAAARADGGFAGFGEFSLGAAAEDGVRVEVELLVVGGGLGGLLCRRGGVEVGGREGEGSDGCWLEHQGLAKAAD